MPVTAPAPVLRLRDASVGYDGDPVARHLDLEVRAGEVVALLGPNGSGKSTVVKGLLGLADVLDGEVEVLGEPVNDRHERWRVGYVPQHLLPTGGVPATVEEVVRSGRLPRLRPWQRFSPADRTQVRRAIDTVGLGELARRPVATLSGGQQRRVLIARALAGQAELLVLDEPTAGVDAANQQALAATLADLVAAGTTIVLVTHELGPAAPLVTRAVVLRAGRIAYDGPPAGTDLYEHGGDHHHLPEHHDRPGHLGLSD